MACAGVPVHRCAELLPAPAGISHHTFPLGASVVSLLSLPGKTGACFSPMCKGRFPSVPLPLLPLQSKGPAACTRPQRPGDAVSSCKVHVAVPWPSGTSMLRSQVKATQPPWLVCRLGSWASPRGSCLSLELSSKRCAFQVAFCQSPGPHTQGSADPQPLCPSWASTKEPAFFRAWRLFRQPPALPGTRLLLPRVPRAQGPSQPAALSWGDGHGPRSLLPS